MRMFRMLRKCSEESRRRPPTRPLHQRPERGEYIASSPEHNPNARVQEDQHIDRVPRLTKSWPAGRPSVLQHSYVGLPRADVWKTIGYLYRIAFGTTLNIHRAAHVFLAGLPTTYRLHKNALGARCWR